MAGIFGEISYIDTIGWIGDLGGYVAKLISIKSPFGVILWLSTTNFRTGRVMNTPIEQIKLLAIDIDGTLLNPHKQITPRTREAVRAAQQAGIIVTLATARRYQNTSPLAQELGLGTHQAKIMQCLNYRHSQRRGLPIYARRNQRECIMDMYKIGRKSLNH